MKMKEKIAEALKHIYGYFTDEDNNGDFLKLIGAALALTALIRFAIGKGFDVAAFASGSGCLAASKAMDIPAVIKNKSL